MTSTAVIFSPLAGYSLAKPLHLTVEHPPENYADGHIHNRSHHWQKSKEDAILEPYNYLVQKKGKDVRGKIIAAFNQWLDVPPEKLAVITRIIEMLHTASLL